MKKRRASNGGSRLPEPVIQLIQSFMSAERAAQTSVLSKSWGDAWSTLPDLELDQRRCGRDYRSYCDVARFLQSARKRIQRYEDSNLIINSFSLSLDRRQSSSCELADELTLRALKLGATKLYLSVCVYLGLPISSLAINAVEFRNLKTLCLELLDVGRLFSDDSSSDFPCLKSLTLTRCISKGKRICISCPLLDSLNFDHSVLSLVTLDVPSIRRFTISGFSFSLPCLDFKRASMGWDSDVSITHNTSDNFCTSWFLKLEAFLKSLSNSKVTLSLEMRFTAEVIELDCARPHLPKRAVVDNLKMDVHWHYIKGSAYVLECLFTSVEPKFITQRWEDFQRRVVCSRKAHKNYINILCKTLMLEVTENCFGNYSSSFPRLDQVIVECFEEALAKWQPMSLKTLLDASTALDDKQLIRFQLQWR